MSDKPGSGPDSAAFPLVDTLAAVSSLIKDRCLTRSPCLNGCSVERQSCGIVC